MQGGARRCRWARSSRSTRTRPAPSSPASPTSGAPRSGTAWGASRAAARYSQVRSGGAGAFTVDNFPVFDHMRPNVFVAADSNHGYKMIAVGREVARSCRRALRAAPPVPLRALRHRRPASGLAQPVPLELTAPVTSSSAAACTGLSAAWGLAERGADVPVLIDKGRIGGGASGIAGGIARNYYRPPTRSPSSCGCRWRCSRKTRRRTGSARSATWRPCPRPRSTTWSRSARSTSAPATSPSSSSAPPSPASTWTWTWPDWEAPVEAALYERRGGWADSMQTVRHLASAPARRAWRSAEGVEVIGFELGEGGVDRGRDLRGRLDCETRGAGAGTVGGRLADARSRGHEVGRRRRQQRPLVPLLEGAGGQFALPGPGLAGRAGRRGAGRPPRPVRAAALGPRRPRARGGPLGHLLPDGPNRHPGYRRRAADPARSPGSSTPTGRTIPRTRSSPAFEEFFVSGLAAGARGASRAAGRLEAERRRRASWPTRPTTTPCATG